MTWDELGSEILDENQFLRELKFSHLDSENSYPLQSLIRTSSVIVLKATRSKGHRLGFLIPVRGNFTRWLAMCHTLVLIKSEYLENRNVVIKAYNRFVPGQKLVFNESSIVQFQRFQGDKLYVLAKGSKNSPTLEIGINLSKILSLQPAQPESKLSSQDRVMEDRQKASIPLLDKVVGISTAGNYQFFRKSVILVSAIGESRSFIDSINTRRNSIKALFKWGYIQNGHSELLYDSKLGAHPSLIITHDIAHVLDLIRNEQDKVEAIYIDGTKFITNNLQAFDRVCETGIPIVVTSDFFEAEELSYLTVRQFLMWKWDKSLVPDLLKDGLSEDSPYNYFTSVCRNYVDQEVVTEICRSDSLSECFECLHKLSKLLEQEPDKVILGRAVRLSNKLSRLVTVPAPEVLTTFSEELQNILFELQRRKLWMKDLEIELFQKVFSAVQTFINLLIDGNNPKHQAILKILENHRGSQNLIILPGSEEKENFGLDLGSKTNSIPKVQIGDLGDFGAHNLSQKNLNVIVCGWLGRHKMFRIIHSYYAKSICLIMYPFEQNYFRMAQRKWGGILTPPNQQNDFSELLGLEVGKLRTEKDDVKEIKPEIHSDNEVDVFEFESKIDNAYYSRFKTTVDDGETLKAKLVELSDDKYLFATEGHRFYRIETTNLGTYDVKTTVTEQLMVYDYLIFTKTDKDVLKDIVRQNLVPSQYNRIEAHIKQWKRALNDCYEDLDSDINALIEKLWEHGCERHAQTINTWLFDSNKLGPQTIEDLRIIANACGDAHLLRDVEMIFNSIREMRGFLISASSQLTNLFLSSLSSLTEDKSFSHSQVNLEIEGFGEITILQVLHLGKPEQMDYRYTNRLYEKGREPWQE